MKKLVVMALGFIVMGHVGNAYSELVPFQDDPGFLEEDVCSPACSDNEYCDNGVCKSYIAE